MTEARQSKAIERRPVVIQLFCGVGFLAIGFPFILLLPAVREPLIAQYGAKDTLISAASALAIFIAALGCWRMRRWGVHVYVVMAVLTVANRLVTDGIQPAVLSALVPLIVTVLLFTQRKGMR